MIHIKRNTSAAVAALGGLLAIGIVLFNVDPPQGRVLTSSVPVVTTFGDTVSTQPTYAGKIDSINHQDGVPFVMVVLTEGPILGYKERAIAGTNLVVGDRVRLVWAYDKGGRNFPVARPIGMTNSWP